MPVMVTRYRSKAFVFVPRIVFCGLVWVSMGVTGQYRKNSGRNKAPWRGNNRLVTDKYPYLPIGSSTLGAGVL